MEPATWYLGPLGNVRALEVPEPGIGITLTRFGGFHQGLSGARTLDVTGHRYSYSFEWRNLDPSEYQWLEALHARLIQGPFRLLNPMKKNRLSVQASTLVIAGTQGGITGNPGTYRYETDWPNAAGAGARSLRISTFGEEAFTRFDDAIPTPVLPDEEITVSLYLKGEAATSVELCLDWYGVSRQDYLSTSARYPVAVTTSWERFSFTITPPAGAGGAVLNFVNQDDTQPVRLAAPQIEPGDTATAFEVGGGSPVVLLDQLSGSSRIFPLTDCSLTLMEA
ncbi:hypothetical protein [Saccharothrix sp. HUAS TT1]|uniref:hypothetical protein n=1 Tax=unclassified Saccharothrix TaxID=2593673 RepID=UPI00345BFB13